MDTFLVVVIVGINPPPEIVILVGVKSDNSLRPEKTGYILQMPIDPLTLPSLLHKKSQRDLSRRSQFLYIHTQ